MTVDEEAMLMHDHLVARVAELEKALKRIEASLDQIKLALAIPVARPVTLPKVRLSPTRTPEW